MVMLIDEGLAPSPLLRESLATTFERYARHPLPSTLPLPPSTWQDTFSALANEVGLSVSDSHRAHLKIQEFLHGLH